MRPGGFGLGVHRAALFEVLFAAAQAGGAEVRTDAQIVDFDGLARPTLRDAKGRDHGPFDIVVVADGSASTLRSKLRPAARAPVYPWGAVWANARDAEGRFAGALSQRYDRASVMIGVLPIGRGPDGQDGLVSLFWSLPVTEMEAFYTGDFAASVSYTHLTLPTKRIV